MALKPPERYYRRHIDLRRWLRVVVDFGESPAWAVTALVQDNPPRVDTMNITIAGIEFDHP